MRFANEKAVVDKSMAASFTSSPIVLDQVFGFSFHAVFTGSPVGTFLLQCSNDDVKLASQVSNWSDIGSSSKSITSAGNIFWNIDNAFYKWVRITYTAGAGSGVCNITFVSKGA
jgi:hypothetical protein